MVLLNAIRLNELQQPCCQKSATMFTLNHHYNICQENNSTTDLLTLKMGARLDMRAEFLG